MTTKVPAELSSTPSIVDNGNSTAITINSSETVMIGKTADNTTDVGVVNGSTGYIYATRDGNIPLVLNRKTSDGTIQQFRKDNTTIGSVAALQSLLGIGNGDAGLLIAGSVDAVAPYNASTNATRDAAINLGTATNRFQNIFLSGGAYLGGTGSANYLDDYEEGTWTPVHGGNNMTGTATYTKIGRYVYIAGDVTSATGSSTASVISGLPFTVLNSHHHGSFVVGWTNTGVQGGYVANAGTNIEAVNAGTNTADTIDAGGRIIFAASYITA